MAWPPCPPPLSAMPFMGLALLPSAPFASEEGSYLFGCAQPATKVSERVAETNRTFHQSSFMAHLANGLRRKSNRAVGGWSTNTYVAVAGTEDRSCGHFSFSAGHPRGFVDDGTHERTRPTLRGALPSVEPTSEGRSSVTRHPPPTRSPGRTVQPRAPRPTAQFHIARAGSSDKF